MPVVTFGAIESPRSATVLHNNFLRYGVLQGPDLPAGGPRVNVTDQATWNSFTPTASSPNIVAEFPTEVTADSVGIAAHSMGTNAATVIVQYSSDGTTWSNATTTYTPTTDLDLFFIFPSITARFWRLNFTGSGFSVGVVFLGKRLIFPHAPVDGYTALHHGRKYEKLFNDSVKGHFLGNRVMSAGAETSVDMGFVSRSFSEGPLRAFEENYNVGKCFFYASCPSLIPLDMGYCRSLGEDETMAVEYIEADKLTNVSFGIRSYVGV